MTSDLKIIYRGPLVRSEDHRVPPMLPVLGVLAAFVLIVALRLRNVDFSVAILAASAVIAITSGRPLDVLIEAGTRTVTDPTTLNLCAAVALITVLGYSLKETSLMTELIDGLRGILPSQVLLAIIPAMFGLLSMPGGALMSAPFNEAEADRLGLKSEHKTYVNVWFRHIWYWASPISPVPILAASLACLSLNGFLVAQLPLFAVTLAIGFMVTRMFIEKGRGKGRRSRNYPEVALKIAPIVATVALSVVGIPIWAALIVGIIMVYAIKKVPAGKALRMAYDGVRWDLAAAVVSMLFFRYVIVASDSVDALFKATVDLGVPLLVIFIAVPLLVGAISGTPTMGIGIVFPLLIPLCGASGIHLASVVYAGVIAGYLASPMHLCLILTNSYYRSELGKVYRYLVPSVATLYAIIVIYHLAMNRFIL
jgi:integral membrane protein (TIGR00529 family)